MNGNMLTVDDLTADMAAWLLAGYDQSDEWDLSEFDRRFGDLDEPWTPGRVSGVRDGSTVTLTVELEQVDAEPLTKRFEVTVRELA